MRRNLIKLFSIAGIFGFLAVVFHISPEFETRAAKDEILEKIADYKTWTRVSKEPIKVDTTFSGIGS